MTALSSDDTRRSAITFSEQGCYPPRIIWILWLQGVKNAPPVVKASHASWQRLNPDYRVHLLDAESLVHFIPPTDLGRIMGKDKEREALSDEIRLELLARYGGVWADATTLCARPLDDWLPTHMPTGFFAFDRPGPERMLSTWFLAAAQGCALIEKWRHASIEYWRERTVRDDYYWCHRLFAEIYETDPAIKLLWDLTPKISARHGFHFGPHSSRLLADAPQGIERDLKDPPVAVFKLTHKLAEIPSDTSLLARLLTFGHGETEVLGVRGPRVLVTWYGSFSGHGTVGDLRAMEAVVVHLIGKGLSVDHASADAEVYGARRVMWDVVSPDDYGAVIFVCGPILKTHLRTKALFEHFASAPLIGVSVSMFAEADCEFCNPFDIVLARQGMADRFGDVAIAAPPVDLPTRKAVSASTEPVIGLSLRGRQGEYGTDRCMADETQAVCDDVIERTRLMHGARVLLIENHLTRSEVSPTEIDAAYRDVDLVLTSRFHGAMLAIRYGTPFIAIDQIRGGAKVHDLLSPMGWPHVTKVDDASAAMLATAAGSLLNKTGMLQLAMVRNQAVLDANRTLRALDSAIAILQRP